MFTKSQTGAKLDAEIMSALETLERLDKTSEEYGDLVERIAKLHKLKMEEHPQRISADTALVVAANIFGVLWIARYENENVIKTKALSFLIKPR